MASLVAPKAGAAPAAICAPRRLVVKPPGVHGQPLHQEGDAATNLAVSLRGQLLQKFLMAENRVGRLRRLERHNQIHLLAAAHRRDFPLIVQR